MTSVTILVAESDEAIRMQVARLLESKGWGMLEARDGADAMRLASSSLTHLDLVITDVMTPLMDGRELGRWLAQSRPELPVLYLSSYVRGDVFHRDGPGAESSFLRKPFSDAELLAKVSALLPRISSDHTLLTRPDDPRAGFIRGQANVGQ